MGRVRLESGVEDRGLVTGELEGPTGPSAWPLRTAWLTSVTTCISVLEEMHGAHRVRRETASWPSSSVPLTPDPGRKPHVCPVACPGKDPQVRPSPGTRGQGQWLAAFGSGRGLLRSDPTHVEKQPGPAPFQTRRGCPTDTSRACPQALLGKEDHAPVPWQTAKLSLAREKDNYRLDVTICGMPQIRDMGVSWRGSEEPLSNQMRSFGKFQGEFYFLHLI